MRKEKGITLIALVITIIVLLTLAGVTVVTLTGDNGLITKASDTKQTSIEAEIREKISLAVTAARTSNSGTLTKESLEKELTKELGENTYEIILIGKGYIIIVDNIQYKIEENGSVQNINGEEKNNIENAEDLSKGGQYDGLTEETAYRVNCIEDLVEWSNRANNYKNKFIKLDKTLDFQKTSDYNDYKKTTTDINGNGIKEALITELTTENGFKSIASFSGTFDGQNNEIRNIHMKSTGNAALFSTTSVTIKNLGVTGEITSTTSGQYTYVGGIIGSGSANTKIVMYNCYSNINIEAPNCGNVGGLIGGNHGDGCSYYIYNCYNLGKINGGDYAGGIIGKSNGGTKYIYNCYNYGQIKAKYVGGLIGYDYFNIPYMNNCFNIGNLESINNSTIGGICYTTIAIPSNRLNNVYYLNDGKVNLAEVRTNYKGDSLSQEYMQSQEFINELNTYVNNYNEEHKNDEGFIALRNWKNSEGAYPTFK